ncbi:MAG: NAD(+) diphosphatase [Lachnospiraceae bacterium]|nr:NAD(+) diphosphatase [Lachnospiraceae bacterium]
MIQDIAPHKFHNEFHLKKPGAQDILLVFNDKKEVLVRKSDEENIGFPRCGEIMSFMTGESASLKDADMERPWELPGATAKAGIADVRCMEYAFSLDENDYYLLLDFSSSVTLPGCEFLSLTQVRADTRDSNRPASLLIMTGWHLYVWYRSNQFCGRCGQRTVRDTKERMLSCPHCGNMIYPRINPAVIVAVTDGDRLLLSRYAGRVHTGYALIAGFVEIGETLEETVAREVMEEVGLKVRNIRYYKSQPWGVDGNVLQGFFCELDGEDHIRLDRRELSMAQWYHREEIPVEDDGYSLTREMIGVFKHGRF